MTRRTATPDPVTNPATDPATDQAPGPASTRHAWALVARREILVKLTDKAFLLGTLLTIGVLTAFLGWQAYSETRASTYSIAATPQTATMATAVATGASSDPDSMRVTVRDVADPAAAERAVRSGDADVLLREGENGWQLVAKQEVPSELLTQAQTVVRSQALAANAARAGTTVAELERGTALTGTVLDGDAERQQFALGMGLMLAMLFYIASLSFGYVLAGSVVEEKSSRVVEIITAKIPTRQLLWGKIAGNVVLAFAQIAVYVGIGLVGLSLTSYSRYLPAVSGAIGWFVAFFVIGFLFIACWWAVAGALASRSEDLQSTSTPLTMLLMAVFFGAFLFKGAALTVASYVPPFSTVLMPIRLLSGDAAWWEPVVALGLLLVAAAVTVVLAERLYRKALLQTQGRLTMRQAWASKA